MGDKASRALHLLPCPPPNHTPAAPYFSKPRRQRQTLGMPGATPAGNSWQGGTQLPGELSPQQEVCLEGRHGVALAPPHLASWAPRSPQSWSTGWKLGVHKAPCRATPSHTSEYLWPILDVAPSSYVGPAGRSGPHAQEAPPRLGPTPLSGPWWAQEIWAWHQLLHHSALSGKCSREGGKGPGMEQYLPNTQTLYFILFFICFLSF